MKHTSLSRSLAGGVFAAICSNAGAANIYMLSSGHFATDSAAAAALTSRGHAVTIGVQYSGFDGLQNLKGYDTVYLQANANWSSPGHMPLWGQQALINWVHAGGRLVTSEWVIHYARPGSKFALLAPILPIVHSMDHGAVLATTYHASTAHASINAGLPPSFPFLLTDYVGTETFSQAQPGATVYYTTGSSPGAPGLAGWARGAGSVFSFTSTCGPVQVANDNFGRLFANVMAASVFCYANCDESTAEPILTVDDFTCFIDAFAAAPTLPHEQQIGHYANCDGSTTAPVLTVDDFTCFINAFAAGCN